MTGKLTVEHMNRVVSRGELDAIDAITLALDRRGRELDEKWGTRRLMQLVPVEWADKFQRQAAKFSEAIQSWNYPETVKHGQAMERAYAKLDELAEASGAEKGPPEQWEFETPDGLVILVKDATRIGQAQTFGRAASVWSLDEIASILRNYPSLIAIKNAFPGAELQSIRPVQQIKLQELNDDVPF
jgi:hypothetical protein